ncbi:MAG: glycerol-3-phosphate acyltransferase, partial [Gemmatimonadaceae bacterium]|nr:glycerol-3-phosphate acyltransferase [Gloeobacterales cyanobacterium ES-bin-141]
MDAEVLELLLIVGAFGLGGLPLTGWLVRLSTGKNLRALGTGNVGVSAAFTHAGTFVGILAVLAEALRGVVGVLAVRTLVPGSPALEVLTLVAVVSGRFWIARGAGITNAFWGLLVYAPVPTGCLVLVMLVAWLTTRARTFTQAVTLILMPLVFYLFEPDWKVTCAVIALAGLMGWTLNQTADDLDRSPEGRAGTTPRFLRGRLKTLDEPLTSQSAGGKAANLSCLRRAGFTVPQGWVLLPGDRPDALLVRHKPSEREPGVVRSSATSEDGLQDSAAGQYMSVLGITDSQAFGQAVEQVRASWDAPAAVAYRESRASAPGAMAVLVQIQIRGIYSGVLFTRDPVGGSECLVVEAVRGGAERVVSGRETPECLTIERNSRVVYGDNTLPLPVIEQLHDLGIAVERFFGGLPQDIEWTWDGERLWLLQARPVTNLQPVWTRTIAAEVIPGVIRPLTWSINRPLTCGVWGEIFTIVLGKRAADIDFNQTATLIEGWAYFNATLLGTIFRRMGLPESSLEFLLTGARFSRPSPLSLVRNLPGLLRLLGRDLGLVKRFAGETRPDPLLAELEQTSADTLSPRQLLERIAEIQAGLRVLTYYNIRAPLGFAIRKALLRVPEDWLSEASTAEVA